MSRFMKTLAVLSILTALPSMAKAQVPIYLPSREPVSFSGGFTEPLFPRVPPLRTVDPTSRDGASLRSRTRPNVYFQGPGVPYGIVPTGVIVPTILPVTGRAPVIYSRAYSGGGPYQYGGAYSLYGGYATANVPEGRPTVIVVPPPPGVLMMPGR